MSLFDDDRSPASGPTHMMGEDVGRLSVEEFVARIALLRDEIVRLETAMAVKIAQRDAADRLFRS